MCSLTDRSERAISVILKLPFIKQVKSMYLYTLGNYIGVLNFKGVALNLFFGRGVQVRGSGGRLVWVKILELSAFKYYILEIKFTNSWLVYSDQDSGSGSKISAPRPSTIHHVPTPRSPPSPIPFPPVPVPPSPSVPSAPHQNIIGLHHSSSTEHRERVQQWRVQSAAINYSRNEGYCAT